MKRLYNILFLCGLSLCAFAQQRQSVNLSGQWDFAIDREGKLKPTDKFEDIIKLPASMLEADKGDKPTVETRWTGSLYDSSYFYNPYMAKYRTEENLKLPFFLTPNRHYVGDAWYRKTVEVPSSFKGKRIMLYLERPHISSTLYINNVEVGACNSLSVAHEYDVTNYVKAGKKAEICLKINNDADKVGVGQDSHSVTDQTQGNWNGVVGQMELRAMPSTYIAHVDVYPDVDNLAVSARVMVVRSGKKAERVDLHLSPWQKKNGLNHGYFGVVKDILLTSDTTYVDVPAISCLSKNDPLLSFKLWDEFHPENICLFETKLLDTKHRTLDCDTVKFGFRKIETRGKDIFVNNRLTMMRGTVENCCFPLTGYPPTDKESWLKVFHKCKSYGLNHMRFHSYCPPEAAFEAADEVGFYLQPEGPSWPNHGIKLGNGMMIDEYLMKETQRMVEKYGNHPSFAMLSCGNEPAGNWVKWVSAFVDYWRAKDPRRIYTGASVGGSWAWQPKNQYHVKAGARGLNDWTKSEPGSMTDFRANIDTVSQPFISHETGQWCVFPDFEETKQYTGVYKAKNFEIFEDILRDKGMEKRAKKFLMSSGKLQALCYKYEMEKTLRTPHYAGYQLLGLNDYSGQGTALVGPLNVFWEDKGYIDSTEWREFCSPITALVRMPRFTYFSGDTIPYSVEVANYSEGVISEMKARVQFINKDGIIVAENLFGGDDIPMGSCNDLGSFQTSFDTNAPVQYTLQVEVFGEVNGKEVSTKNHWNVWIYPRHTREELDGKVDMPFFICKDNAGPGEEALKTLRKGGTVLVIAGKNVSYGQGIQQYYTPVFWNTSWFKMKPPHTTGMYVEKDHPLFKNFPTDDFSDLQWWALMNRQPVMLLDEFPKDFEPVIQPIDTWFLSRKLGMLFEANVEGGKLLMTTMPFDLQSSYPAIQQMSYAIMTYVLSDEFRPKQSVPFEKVQQLFTDKTPDVNMFTNDSPDELKKGVR